MKQRRHRRGPVIDIPTVVADNIRQLLKYREKSDHRLGIGAHIADAITYFSGTMEFLWIHVAWFAIWIAVNLKWIPGLGEFDPYPFGLLTMIVSLEAIFLSTIVLISQNRLQELADRRAELDLHINLLSENESTLILKKLSRIEKALEIDVCAAEAKQVTELTKDTNPVDIVSTIENLKQPMAPHKSH